MVAAVGFLLSASLVEDTDEEGIRAGQEQTVILWGLPLTGWFVATLGKNNGQIL